MKNLLKTVCDKFREININDDHDFQFSSFYNHFFKNDAKMKTECVSRSKDNDPDFFIVMKFSKDDETVYTKVTGSYGSYYGYTFEKWTPVQPREITITVYE